MSGAPDNPILEALVGRRSIMPKRLVPPGPNEEELRRIVAAACCAPDHGGLRPARFILVPAERRDDLAGLFVAAKRAEAPDASEDVLARAGQKAHHAPALVAVKAIVAPDGPVPVEEQLVAVGAAIQNVLVAAHGLGYAASILSGTKTRSDMVRAAFDVGPQDYLVGFISIGTPTKIPDPRPTFDLEMVFSKWMEK